MSYVLPASTKLIIIPTPSICTQTLRIFDVLFTGLISSKWLTIIFFCTAYDPRQNSSMHRPTFHEFSTAKALKSQRFKESSFPKATVMERVGSRNLASYSYAKSEKTCVSKGERTKTFNCFVTITVLYLLLLHLLFFVGFNTCFLEAVRILDILIVPIFRSTKVSAKNRVSQWPNNVSSDKLSVVAFGSVKTWICGAWSEMDHSNSWLWFIETTSRWLNFFIMK